jgi:hypothetical protein
MEMLRRELEQVKQALAKAQEETQKGVQETKKELVKGQEETKQELAVVAAVQEVANQRMTAIEAKMDTLIGLLKPGGGEGTCT